MNPSYFATGDTVAVSPVGPGTITGITQAGYPQVNDVAVACLKRTDGEVFDPHGHYAKLVKKEEHPVMRIYIAGPMTGLKDLNFPAFHAVAATLRAAGHIAINPAEINPDPNAEWTDCMLADLTALTTCDAIVMLTGWETSPGAQIERLWSLRTKKKVFCATKLSEVMA